MPKADITIERDIATRLRDLYEFVHDAAENNHDDSARYGALSSIVVLLHQPLEVADGLVRG
jgi:hypothetical protein